MMEGNNGRPGGGGFLATPSQETAVTKLDTWEWFGNRTFHYSQFEPLAKLRAARERTGTTISVCLPARNEAATIGPIVRVLRRALLERSRLVDEIVVMDGGSDDDTVAIAAAEGAIVYREQDVLPELGPVSGKGEGLWKSLYVCGGDLMCWIDADIRNIHPRFVYGLLGPLLTDPGVVYVKAFYERPLQDRRTLRATGGGRVTELVARPLLNLFWPELAGFVQPLSGEYAGRREVLEQIPMISGYGVELGMLIDIARYSGANAMAQVDLERRVHRNQDVQALSRMSFGILQAAFSRLVDEGKVAPGSWSTTLLQFANRLREYNIEPREISVTQRPPMATLDSYRQRRSAPAAGSSA
jgi:glucosyl-3-phosphoglycerate synthase